MAKMLDQALTDEELDQLDQFLYSDAVGKDAMSLSMLHGYLTAILIGPAQVMPTEWLGQIWDKPEAVMFAQPEADAMIDLVMRLYNQIADELAQEPPVYEPLLYWEDDSQQHSSIEEWSLGFCFGAGLAEEEWQPLLEEEEGQFMFMAIMSGSDDEMRADMQREGINLVQHDNEIAEQLPEIVLEIRDFFRNRQISESGKHRLH
ncbi:YecA family protein [Chitinibacter sp. S2-10]|uniref:YecA/YgfB family protein n=1 Tax=Chitinibacter sp. S2-10 TaxID=3373597 RepID=UPI003977CA4A